MHTLGFRLYLSVLSFVIGGGRGDPGCLVRSLVRCPDWPPPPDEKIGIGRARTYVAWIRDHAARFWYKPRR